jgi:hypothetical protein
MGCASVYLSWAVYVIIYGMFLLVQLKEMFSGREETRTVAGSSTRMVIECLST